MAMGFVGVWGGAARGPLQARPCGLFPGIHALQHPRAPPPHTQTPIPIPLFFHKTRQRRQANERSESQARHGGARSARQAGIARA